MLFYYVFTMFFFQYSLLLFQCPVLDASLISLLFLVSITGRRLYPFPVLVASVEVFCFLNTFLILG